MQASNQLPDTLRTTGARDLRKNAERDAATKSALRIARAGVVSFRQCSAVAYLFLADMLSKPPFTVRLGDDTRHIAGQYRNRP
jgi:hypothetical protein